METPRSRTQSPVEERPPHAHTPPMLLRALQETDLEALFRHQEALDFGRPRADFFEQMRGLATNEDVVIRVIDHAGQVAGYVSKFLRDQTPEVAYVLGQQFRGQGLATKALAGLLEELGDVPLFARTAKDNFASIAVLQKNGFVLLREEQWRRTKDSPLLDDFVWTRPSSTR